MFIEHKGLAVSVHFRRARDTDAALGRAIPVVERVAREEGLASVTRGRLVLEISPPVQVDKGDVVRLTFGHVGLTPGDRYDAFVSGQSHLMTHWDYKLQSGDKGAWDWEYSDHNGLKLAKNHTSAKMSINMGDVRVLDTVDDAFLTDPKKTLAELK